MMIRCHLAQIALILSTTKGNENVKEHTCCTKLRWRWDIKQSGGQRSSGHFDTKQKAVDRAREISRNQKTELVIHNKDAAIGLKDSHGNDPHPPKG